MIEMKGEKMEYKKDIISKLDNEKYPHMLFWTFADIDGRKFYTQYQNKIYFEKGVIDENQIREEQDRYYYPVFLWLFRKYRRLLEESGEQRAKKFLIDCENDYQLDTKFYCGDLDD